MYMTCVPLWRIRQDIKWLSHRVWLCGYSRRRRYFAGVSRVDQRLCVGVSVRVCQHDNIKTTGHINTKLGRWMVHDKCWLPLFREEAIRILLLIRSRSCPGFLNLDQDADLEGCRWYIWRVDCKPQVLVAHF